MTQPQLHNTSSKYAVMLAVGSSMLQHSLGSLPIRDKRFTEYFSSLFSVNVRQAKEIIESGTLGEIVLYENSFCSYVDMANRWNSNKDLSGGGVLIDNGPHSIDIARFLVGPIKNIHSQMGKNLQKLDVEDTCRMTFETEMGILGLVDLSWSLDKSIESYISIYGTEGVLSIGWKESKYRLQGKKDWVLFGNGYDKHSAFVNQHQHFVDCILKRDVPVITPLDGLESVKILARAYQSTQNSSKMQLQDEIT